MKLFKFAMGCALSLSLCSSMVMAAESATGTGPTDQEKIHAQAKCDENCASQGKGKGTIDFTTGGMEKKSLPGGGTAIHWSGGDVTCNCLP